MQESNGHLSCLNPTKIASSLVDVDGDWYTSLPVNEEDLNFHVPVHIVSRGVTSRVSSSTISNL